MSEQIKTTDLLDEVVAAEKARTATSMEIRLGLEVSNLRSRNALLDRLVHRLEIEGVQMAAELTDLRGRVLELEVTIECKDA